MTRKEKALENIRRSTNTVRIAELCAKYIYLPYINIDQLREMDILEEGTIEDEDYYVTNRELIRSAYNVLVDDNTIDRLTEKELDYWASFDRA